MKTIFTIQSKDEAKQFIAQKMYEQWIKENPGLEEDILELSTQITMFNIKWGTKLDLTNPPKGLKE